MDDIKEEKQSVKKKNTISKDVIREILEELHILTSLSPLKLLTLLKELNELVDKKHKLILPEKGLSIAALYRNNKNSAPIGAVKTIKELKGKNLVSLKNYEGQLRLRIIEIPIRYKKRKNIANFETLRLLCSYEVKTGNLDYEKLPSDPQEITENLIMDHVKRKQTELEVAIVSVVFTQRFVLHPENMLNWDWGLSSFTLMQSLLNSPVTKIEQIDSPARKHAFSIYGGVKDKSHFEDVCDAFVKNHRQIIIDRKCNVEINNFKSVYDDFYRRIKRYVRKINKNKKMFPFTKIYNTTHNPISATFNMSDKNARKYFRDIEKKQTLERINLLKQFKLPVPENFSLKGHYLNGFYPKIWNFEYEQKVSSVFQEWIRHDYPNGEHVIYLSIKLDSCEPIWIHYDENLQSKFNQKDLRQGDLITIIYFKAEEDDDDSEPVFVDIKMNYQQTLDELLSSSPKDALALTDEDKDWLNFPAGGNEIR